MTESNQKSQVSIAASLSSAAAVERLSEQVKFGHRAWMERLQEMQAVEAEFTKELLTTRDPNATLKVCNRRVTKRLELLTADSTAFAAFWMDIVTPAAAGARTPAASRAMGDDA